MKIVELIVKLNELEIDDLGVDAVALVENPAIEMPFLAFSEEHKFVEPAAGETEGEFISRCIPVVIGEGYEQDQAAAICYSYWENKQFDDGLYKFQDAVMMQTVEYGETYNPDEVVYIDATKEQFSTIGDFLKGVTALDILSRNQTAREGAVTRYRYSGPIAQRNFCKAMQRLNKIYSREEINEMEQKALNSAFGHNGSAYSIWKFAGGPNCRHFWEELTVFRGQSNELIFISHGAATQAPTDMPSKGYYPGTERARSARMGFSIINEEQRVVVGPVLVPNKLIRRVDKRTGEEYFVFFSEQTIKDIAELMFKRGQHNRTNLEHDSVMTDDDNTLLESWIVEDPEYDKAKLYGFDVPTGTLMQSRRINSDFDWQRVKDGLVRGFSVEGNFIEKAQEQEPDNPDTLMSQIIGILKQID